MKIKRESSRPSAFCAVIRSMMVLLIAVVGMGHSHAEPWSPVFEKNIDLLLSGKHVIYEGEPVASQTFHADGTTTYVEGRPSLGNWKSTDTHYCSQWPPSREWTCYAVFTDADGRRLRFTSDSGQEWIAAFAE